jgi:hypothetical protein
MVTLRSRLRPASSVATSKLVAEVERGCWLVEQQHFGRLRQCACNDDALLFAAAERHVISFREMTRARGVERVM